ncbi:ABC-type transport auxiliary lipoprotein family protein [Ottowia sp. VDI28]|uniref:ABC-type transport auxiliary lipoprotein family protein n=1 Tax=Ottowia sp. VDI28 TaxID=3133968 RepID=UPI003C2B6CCF
MKFIATRTPGVLALIALLAGCSGLPLPDKPTRPLVYDFGPGVQTTAPAATGSVPVALSPVSAPSPLEGLAVTYRLLYSDGGQQPRPYAQARWSMSPAQLVAQRLRETLAAQRPVVSAGEGLARLELHLGLEEFSHVFDSPSASFGVVRLRATAVAPLVRGERLLGQRTFTVRQPAATLDAAGGVRALTEATDQVARELSQWLAQLPAPNA